MPRAFDSDDVARAQEPVLHFTENVECEECGLVFEGHYVDASMTVEDIAEPPEALQTCPGCRHRFFTVFSGWTFYSEAG